MSGLREALESIDLDTFFSHETFMELPEEDQEILREFFREYGTLSPSPILWGEDRNATLIATGFILGHNFVKEYWTLW